MPYRGLPIDQRLDKVEERLDKIEAKLERINEKLAEVDQRNGQGYVARLLKNYEKLASAGAVEANDILRLLESLAD